MLRTITTFLTAVAIVTANQQDLAFYGNSDIAYRLKEEFSEPEGNTIDDCNMRFYLTTLMHRLKDINFALLKKNVASDDDLVWNLQDSPRKDMKINALVVSRPCGNNVFGLNAKQHKKIRKLFKDNSFAYKDKVLKILENDSKSKDKLRFSWVAAVLAESSNRKNKQTEYLMTTLISFYNVVYSNPNDILNRQCLFFKKVNPSTPMFHCKKQEDSEEIAVSLSATGEMRQQPKS